MDSAYKALADPNRRKILKMLQAKDMTVTEIGNKLRVTGPTLSHHLDALKRAHLVLAEREGQFIRYSLNTSVFEDVIRSVYSLFPVKP